MSFHNDLLDQAGHLANRESRRPKQASLRRAISAAYYAVFHRLAFETAALFVKDQRLANCINRAPSHSAMNAVSKSFANDEWPKGFDNLKKTFRIPSELKRAAQAFVDLQEARHDADYNLERKFTRSETIAFVKRARLAFHDLDAVRKDDLARIYFACFLVWKDWDRKR